MGETKRIPGALGIRWKGPWAEAGFQSEGTHLRCCSPRAKSMSAVTGAAAA